MSEKKCSSCGSEMGLGAPSAENVKACYECWCGNVEVEFLTEEELRLKQAATVAAPTSKPNSAVA
jgi:hypothetical protein